MIVENRMEAAGSERVILIAMDGSECSDYAFESKVMTDITIMSEVIAKEGLKSKQLLQVLAKKLENKKMHTRGKVMSVGGKPGEIIVRVAKEENAAMIVTGTRGLGKIRRTLMGSISDYVVHHTHTPVLVCRRQE